jgi:hypothetical protein
LIHKKEKGAASSKQTILEGELVLHEA